MFVGVLERPEKIGAQADHSHLPECLTMKETERVGCRAEGASFEGLFDETTGNWTEFPHVYAVYEGSASKRGPLTIGFGFQSAWIGPEYAFGKVLGEYYNDKNGDVQNVLVLKWAWGGTDLEHDWRPPSSGGEVGWCYGNMTQTVHRVLETQLDEFIPGFSYRAGDTSEIVGFGWQQRPASLIRKEDKEEEGECGSLTCTHAHRHQGWNDGCADTAAADYEDNLANLIDDVRAEFESPALPFSISLSGFGGWAQSIDRRLEIMRAQYNVSTYGRFAGTVATTETRGFSRLFGETNGAINQGYHWFGNGETYYYIGTAMGRAIIQLIEKSWVQPIIDTKVQEGASRLSSCGLHADGSTCEW